VRLWLLILQLSRPGRGIFRLRCGLLWTRNRSEKVSNQDANKRWKGDEKKAMNRREWQEERGTGQRTLMRGRDGQPTGNTPWERM
jgi:hypothetical protein